MQVKKARKHAKDINAFVSKMSEDDQDVFWFLVTKFLKSFDDHDNCGVYFSTQQNLGNTEIVPINMTIESVRELVIDIAERMQMEISEELSSAAKH